MPSPLERLAAMEAGLGDVTAKMAAIASGGGGPNLPSSMPGGPPDLPMPELPEPAARAAGGAPEIPSLPGFATPSLAHEGGGSLAGGRTDMSKVEQLLERILTAIERGGSTVGGGNGQRRASMSWQRPGSEMLVPDLDAEETFPASSPSIERSSSLDGSDGAGVAGAGSQWRRTQNLLSQSHQQPSRAMNNIFLESGRKK